jgi:SAM-dependent methyltransferase
VRNLRDIRGLKYPDEFVVRHFFKRGLGERTGRVLELGGGVGNNLSLYAQYGWAMTDVDYSAEALADARWNLGDRVELIEADLSKGPPALSGAYEALIIPNLICYVTRDQAVACLAGIRPHLAEGCEVFVRTRTPDDYRCGKGTAEADGWRLATPETGEAGLFNRFYTADQLSALLVEALGFAEAVRLSIRFDNHQAGRIVPGNDDVVLWGTA